MRDDIEPLIERAAKTVYWTRPFNRFVELEDLRQEAWLTYLERQDQFDRLVDDPERIKYVRYSLRKACAGYARREMWWRLGVDPADQYRYSKGEVRGLCELFFDEQLDRFKAESVDFGRGWACLPNEDREALRWAYGSDRQEAMSVAEQKRAQRAAKRLQGLMCGRAEDADLEALGAS